MKQVHCCIWNYLPKEWHFTVDEVGGNLQDTSADVQVNSFGIYLSGQSMFRLSHPYNSSAIQNKSLFPLPLWFFSCEFDFLVNTRMGSEQRFFQLLHWQAFSYWEKATCSVVASHCMIKHDLMFSQMSLLLLLPGLLLCHRLWLWTLYPSRTKFCSAQVEREIIEVPVSPCFIQQEQWLFVLPV